MYLRQDAPCSKGPQGAGHPVSLPSGVSGDAGGEPDGGQCGISPHHQEVDRSVFYTYMWGAHFLSLDLLIFKTCLK